MYRFACLVLCGLSYVGLSNAQEVDIPPELKPWESWVMHGEEYRRCPMRQSSNAQGENAFVCTWPGRLRVSVGATAGQFSQRWQVYAESWVVLPGEPAHWPESIQVNGKQGSVVARNGQPYLRLARGDYSISGEFHWARRPESLRIPASVALVDLQIDGKSIAPVELRGDRLWLGAVRTVSMPRALQVQVYRLLEDGIPLQLTTQLQLKVSGDAREELLAKALPEGFVPMSIDSALPARFEPDGKLRVQVRSGEHVVKLVARAVRPANSIVLAEFDGLWAEDEIWSYRSDDRLRVTAIESPPAIDPAQAGVPDIWRGLPAYRLRPGAGIAIAERTRGLNNVDANRLYLQRDLWLDFNHEGFTALDRITGRMQQGWRLDMLVPYQLLNARRGSENMLITDGDEQRTGIELRTPEVSIETLSRTVNASSQPATGWDTRFERVNAILHLAPGHRLIAAWGVDDAADTWIGQWRLLDLFLLMLVSVAAFKLLGVRFAVVAALAVVLTYHEPRAPTWLWLNLVIAMALAKGVPESRLRRWVNGYQALSLAALLVALMPFAIAQYQLALHPQMAARPQFPAQFDTSVPMEARMLDEREDSIAPMAPPASAVLQATRTLGRRAENMAQEVAKPQAAALLDRYAPDAKLQTGPGIPVWSYINYRLNWSGPVDAQQSMRLWIVPPWLLSLWRLAGLILSALLLIALVRLAYGTPRQWRWPPAGVAASLGMLGLLFVFGGLQRVQAATPDPALLQQLKERLTAPPKCVPACGDVAFGSVSIAGNRLAVELQVHAQANVAAGMPQAGTQWNIERVTVDGRESNAMARAAGSQLHLPLQAGVHVVELSGSIVGANELTLEFAQPPHRIQVRAEGWDVAGLSDGRLLNNALQLTRNALEKAGEPVAQQRFAPFVRIQRRVSMNLDWTVTTLVHRLAPAEGAFTMRLPLLPGESVLTPGMEVRDGTVLVSLAAGTRQAEWQSSLPQLDRLQWVAAEDQPWSEQWEVIVSPMWHVAFAGTPAILPDAPPEGTWINQFLPRPGETLDLTATRPVASAGATLAVDNVNVSTSFGQRLSSTGLRFVYRSSQGGRHDIRLPENAQVESVSVDGQNTPIRPQQGVLPLTLAPGEHSVALQFSRDAGVGMVSRPAPIDLGTDASNVRTELSLGANRWVLFTWGAGVGPAVTYWSELLLFAVLAVALGRLRRTPLKTRDWLFLGLGLSTFSWWVLLVMGAWLLILDSRGQWTIRSRIAFNLMQVALGILTVVALGMLVSAIPNGLLGQPDMGIRSPGMYGGELAWFLDRTGAELPQPAVLSVSIWFYKLAMLIWALWLSFALLRWLPWAWKQYCVDGLWKGKVVRAPQAKAT